VSTRYSGGVITKTPVVPAGPFENGTAPGIWTLDQQLQAQKAGIWPTAGLQPDYIEDVFSTYLYAGNRPTGQSIPNGIDLAGKGGLVWLKARNAASYHQLSDSASGVSNGLYSNRTDAQFSYPSGITSFNSSGFTLGSDTNGTINETGNNYVSWTFREQPKFFDVVTYTGTGANRTISHNLGSVPGMMIIKRTDTTGAWQCYHRSLANTQYMVLNTTAAVATGATRWNSTTPTDTVFSLGTDTTVNASAGTYVAYLFAHDAGGFGLTGTDNVISCGTFTTDVSANATVTLGYEPQFVIFKRTDSATNGDWVMFDNMRGMPATGSGSTAARLKSNTADVENPNTGDIKITSTGFVVSFVASATFIYIAIRRGPMKVPTDATKVFIPVSTASASNPLTVTTGFPVDLSISRAYSGSANNNALDRLRGSSTASSVYSVTNTTAAQVTTSSFGIGLDNNTEIIDNGFNAGASNSKIYWNFRRAPGFFDEVCYTGTGANTTQAHNLAAVPQLMIVKGRSGATAWQVYSSALANTEYLVLNTTAAKATGATRWNSTTPTSSVFSIGAATEVNTSAATYVAYLFSTVAGVSKVGSYTGNGTTQTIDCGFGAGGVRFVLIKRTDATGDWYVYDTARGMTVLTDPYLLLNSTAAEVATLGSVTTVSTGFALNSTILAAINVNAGTYIFLAIA